MRSMMVGGTGLGSGLGSGSGSGSRSVSGGLKVLVDMIPIFPAL
jgi:hypothetical protein